MKNILAEFFLFFMIGSLIVAMMQDPLATKETVPLNVKFSDVKPIFKNRCAQCHNWTYEAAFEKRDKIRDRVSVKKNMPSGGFMPQSERDLIREWVDQGARE